MREITIMEIVVTKMGIRISSSLGISDFPLQMTFFLGIAVVWAAL